MYVNIEQWLGAENKLGIDIWKGKYQFEGETFEEWIERVSHGNKEIAELIRNKRFLFGGRILANRGLDEKGRKVTYSNCYVLPQVGDSIEDIYKTCSDLARTFSYGGGVGIDISKLRPKDSFVNNTARKTSGACSFMDTFSQVTETIGQNGRRGALMISIDCTHPELLDFIEIKNDLDRVTKANISVRVTDDFMRAVVENKDWELYFKSEHEETKKTVKAKEVFRLLCKNNWNMAEPGILFWDRIENYNLLSKDEEFHYAGVNPCAEEPLPNGGSCLLGSFNLNAYVKDKKFNLEDRITLIYKVRDRIWSFVEQQIEYGQIIYKTILFNKDLIIIGILDIWSSERFVALFFGMNGISQIDNTLRILLKILCCHSQIVFETQQPEHFV